MQFHVGIYHIRFISGFVGPEQGFGPDQRRGSHHTGEVPGETTGHVSGEPPAPTPASTRRRGATGVVRGSGGSPPWSSPCSSSCCSSCCSTANVAACGGAGSPSTVHCADSGLSRKKTATGMATVSSSAVIARCTARQPRCVVAHSYATTPQILFSTVSPSRRGWCYHSRLPSTVVHSDYLYT